MYKSTSIEALETRIAPAAIVTVELTGGALKLTGDNGDATVTVTALDATHYLLTAGTDTTFTKGTDTGLTTLILDGPFKSLAAEFGSGSDTLNLIGADFKGDLGIKLGDGTTNTVSLSSVTAGSLSVDGGTGADSVATLGGGVVVKGIAKFDFKAGDNGLAIGGTNFVVGKDFSYTGTTGADGLLLSSNVAIKGSATINLGAGNATVAALGASFSVGKKLSIDGSAALTGETVGVTLFAPTLTVGGDLEIKTGAGNDTITNFTLGGNNSIKGNVSLSTGAGDDSAILLLYGGKSKGVIIDGGDGTNMIGVALAGASTGSISIKGGTGSDTGFAVAIGGKVGAIDVDLGEGSNSVFGILASASAKSFNYTGGAGSDSVIFGGLQSKVAGGVTATVGAGGGSFGVFGLGGSIGGTVKLDSASVTGESTTVFLAGVKTTFGGLDLKLGDGGATASIQPDLGGGIPLPIPPIPGLPSIPSLGGLLQGLTVKGPATITGGAGSDGVQIGGTGVTFSSLTLDLGAGDDQFVGPILGFAESIKIAKFNFKGGAGDDSINFNGQGSLGAAVIDMGDGDNTAGFVGGDRPLTFSSLTYTSASIAGEFDGLLLAKVQVLGKLDAQFGAGNSSFTTDDSLFNGPVNIATGAGADAVVLDTAPTGYATTFAKAVTIDLGDDADSFTVGGTPDLSFIIAKSTFKVDGGGGTNTKTFDETKSILAKTPTYLGFA